MKKQIVFAFAMVSVLQACGQKMNASKVPGVVKTILAEQFPNATAVSWELENGRYEARFEIGNRNMSTLQMPNGNLIETETGIKISELPPVATDYMKTHYKGISLREAAKIIKTGGEINYEAGLKNKDILFDARGNFLKEVKD